VRWSCLTLLAVASAHAAPPRSIALERERTAMAGGHATLRLAEGALVRDDVADVDWGDTRFTIEIGEVARRDTVGCTPSMITSSPYSSRVEHLATRAAYVAYGAVIATPRREPRSLVYVACAQAPDGSIGIARFYVSPSGLDDVADWIAIARTIASTLEVRAEPAEPAVHASPAPVPVATPRGWSVSSDAGFRQHTSALPSANATSSTASSMLDL